MSKERILARLVELRDAQAEAAAMDGLPQFRAAMLAFYRDRIASMYRRLERAGQ